MSLTADEIISTIKSLEHPGIVSTSSAFAFSDVPASVHVTREFLYELFPGEPLEFKPRAGEYNQISITKNDVLFFALVKAERPYCEACLKGANHAQAFN